MKNFEEFFEKNYSTSFFYGFQQKSFFRKLSNLLKDHSIGKLTKEQNLLTIGFGNLEELNSLKKVFNTRITAIDILKKKLMFYARELKRNNRFSVLHQNVNQMDFEKDYFQVVFAKDVFCFIEEMNSFFANLKLILEKKGYFILNLDIYREKENLEKNSNYKQYLRHKISVKNYSLEEIIKSLQSNQFKIIEQKIFKKDVLIIAQKK